MFSGFVGALQCLATADVCERIPTELRAKIVSSAWQARLEQLAAAPAAYWTRSWSAEYLLRTPSGGQVRVWVCGAGERGVICLARDGCQDSRRCVVAQQVQRRLNNDHSTRRFESGAGR